MAGRTDEHELRSDEVKVLLATHGFGREREAAGAALLASDDPLRVVWANRAATRLFGTDEPSVITGLLFGGRARESLAAAAAALLPEAGLRPERLRLVDGFRTRTLTVLLGRAAAADGRSVIVVAVPSAGRGQGADPAFAFDALRPGVPEPSQAPPEAAPRPPAVMGRRRFLWRTEAAHHLIALAQVPPGLRDLEAAARRGTALSDLLAGLGIAEAAAVAAMLATERSWSGIEVAWPATDDRPPIPVVLGAVPLHDAAGGFAGFRGFGTAEFGEASDATPPAGSEPVPAAEDEEPVVIKPAAVTGPETLPPDESAADEIGAEMAASAPEPDVTREAEPERRSPEPEAVARPEALPATPPPTGETEAHFGLRASFSSAKIVALRPSRPQSDAGQVTQGPAGGRDEETGGRDRAGSVPSNLSVVEQLNFGEIARALRDGRAGATPSPEPGVAEEAEAILSALPVAVVVDRGGRTVYANAAFLTLTGYASVAAFAAAGGRLHLLGGLDAAEVAEPERDRAFPAIDAAGRVLSVQGRLKVLTWRGATAEVLTLHPAPEGAAEVQSLRLEIARRDAETSDYRALLDRTADPSTIVDGQGRILALNRPAERVFGRDQAGAIGESLGALLTPDSQSAALGAVFRAASAGPDAAEARLTIMARRREGGPLALQARVGALSGGTVGLVFRDESEVRTQRETIAILQAERDRSGGARSEFLAKVSHEIRTPLNAILGFAEVMLDERFGPLGNPRYKDYLVDIRAAGRHVIDFVTDLMDLSAVETGQHSLLVAATDVNGIIRESVADMQGQAHRDRVIVRLSLTTGLRRALVDAKAMRQVIDNILSNAIRFNEPGGQVIVSTAAGEGEAVTVRIRDTGIGMSEGELAIAMEPFRDISTGKPGGGSGLGLPLTRALVEANQATLSIKSRKHEGTLVEVVLRAAPVEQSAGAPAD